MSNTVAAQSVFLTLVRSIREKARARLLIDSIRSFGGDWSDCPIWLFETLSSLDHSPAAQLPCASLESAAARSNSRAAWPVRMAKAHAIARLYPRARSSGLADFNHPAQSDVIGGPAGPPVFGKSQGWGCLDLSSPTSQATSGHCRGGRAPMPVPPRPDIEP